MRTTIARILVPTDFSAPADAALEYATALASRLGASLHVVHVIDDQYLGGSFAGETYIPEMPNLRAMLTKEAEELLEQRVAPLREQNARVEASVAVGRAFRAIVEQAAEHRADLIVMGTHGRSGVAHLLLGSVAERIVRTAPCPVLTVRDTTVPETAPARVPVVSASTVV